MMLTEVTAVPEAALPIAAMKEHLRLGSGFTDDGLQDTLVAAYLKAAIAVIEGRTGKALLSRKFLLRLDDWRPEKSGQSLPVAPVLSMDSIALVSASEGRTVLPASSWRLIPDLSRPRIASASALPAVPAGGWVEVQFDAGFGPSWSDVPADLGQAVLLLAAEFYEHRHDGGRVSSALPRTVQSLIQRWRTVRVLGGGAV